MSSAVHCLEQAEDALANDSILQGETLLRKTIRLAEESEDWHTNYIAYQRLAEALAESNPEEALQLMKKALSIYELHPDDMLERMPHKWHLSMRVLSTKHSTTSIKPTT